MSGQLNCECFALAFRNVYTFGPTFRAENSNTPRHAAEFWMIEPEIAFADLGDDMKLAESMVKYIIRYVLEKAPEEIDFLNSFVDKGLKERLEHVASSDFAHVTYTEAIEILEKNNDNFDYKAYWGCDLQTEHERFLSEKTFGRPVFVTDYPKEIKAFYMRMNDDNKTVAAMDMLVPGIGESIGGSQREERYDKLVARMQELGLKEEDYWWYLELRKFGGVKHAGFGIGFERLIMYLTGRFQHPRCAALPAHSAQCGVLKKRLFQRCFRLWGDPARRPFRRCVGSLFSAFRFVKSFAHLYAILGRN